MWEYCFHNLDFTIFIQWYKLWNGILHWNIKLVFVKINCLKYLLYHIKNFITRTIE